jgi:hypothetical protein
MSSPETLGLVVAAIQTAIIYAMNKDRMSWFLEKEPKIETMIYVGCALSSFVFLLTSASIGKEKAAVWLYLVSSIGYALGAGNPEGYVLGARKPKDYDSLGGSKSPKDERSFVTVPISVQVLFLVGSVASAVANASVQTDKDKTALGFGIAAAVLSFATDGLYSIYKLFEAYQEHNSINDGSSEEWRIFFLVLVVTEIVISPTAFIHREAAGIMAIVTGTLSLGAGCMILKLDTSSSVTITAFVAGFFGVVLGIISVAAVHNEIVDVVALGLSTFGNVVFLLRIFS